MLSAKNQQRLKQYLMDSDDEDYDDYDDEIDEDLKEYIKQSDDDESEEVTAPESLFDQAMERSRIEAEEAAKRKAAAKGKSKQTAQSKDNVVFVSRKKAVHNIDPFVDEEHHSRVHFKNSLQECSKMYHSTIKLKHPAPHRAYYSSARIDQKLYIFGGRDDTRAVNAELFYIDTEKNTVKQFPPITKIAGGRIFYNGSLFVLASGRARDYQTKMLYYDLDPKNGNIIGAPSNVYCRPEKLFNGVTDYQWRQNLLSIRESERELLDPISAYSSTFSGGYLVIFGGMRKQSYTNDIVLFYAERRPRAEAYGVLISRSNAPSPRYGSAMCTIGSNVYLFGGQNETRMFNDLYTFNVDRLTWTEIDVLGSCPPPMAFTAHYEHNDHMYLVGGMSAAQSSSQTRIDNNLYCYSAEKNSWSVVLPTNHETLPSRAALNAQKFGNRLILFGGVDASFRTSNDVVVINNFYELGFTPLFPAHFRKMLDDGTFSDVTLICYTKQTPPSDEVQVLRLHAHRCVLAARSKHFRQLFGDKKFVAAHTKQIGSSSSSSSSSSGARESVLEIEVSDFDGTAYGHYIRFLYTGELELQTSQLVKNVLKIARHYGDEDATRLCTRGFYMDTGIAIQKRVQADLSGMINNSNAFCDIVLHTSDGGTIHAHKMALVRVEYFRSMLESGMQESQTRDVHIEHVSRDALLHILKFIYVDKIDELDASLCVEIYASARLFGLELLLDYCKEIIVSNLDPTTACDLFDVADLYEDTILKAKVFKFALSNASEVTRAAAADEPIMASASASAISDSTDDVEGGRQLVKTLNEELYIAERTAKQRKHKKQQQQQKRKK